MLVALAACQKPVAPEVGTMAVSTPPPQMPAGRVADGVYVDGRWPLSVLIPTGWASVVAPDGSPARLTLTDPDGDVSVTIAVTPGDTATPRALPGCTWSFEDLARYRAVKVPEPVLVATCSPERPGEPRVLAYVIAHAGVRWHIEGEIPEGHLRAGREDLDQVVAGVRFR